MNTHQYLHNGTYHVDTSTEYMVGLGIDEETQESIIRQQEFEAEQTEKQRLQNRENAYKAESDPLFLESMRKSAAGDVEGSEVARALGLESVARIQAKYPI